jgi:hypothetical protein
MGLGAHEGTLPGGDWNILDDESAGALREEADLLRTIGGAVVRASVRAEPMLIWSTAKAVTPGGRESRRKTPW